MSFQGYATDAERIEARRRTWRNSKHRAYTHYTDLCEEAGVSTQRNWQRHYKKLRGAVQPYELVNALLIRREANPHKRWWLERHSLAEIRELGRHIDHLSIDQVAA